MEARGEKIENELFWGGDWERKSLEIWSSHSRQANLIIDIGANTGVYALAAKAANPAARVIAFEPIVRIADLMRHNVAMNNYDIQVEAVAVSDRTGTATIHDVADGMNYGASLEDFPGNETSYEIQTVSLDDYLASRDWPRVDLIKVDVETHEPAVFRGMQETIERFKPTILVEVLNDEIGRQLVQRGYEYFAIDEKAGLVPVPRPQPLGGRNWNNLLVASTPAPL
jgi:FkbM family methyltransferase